MDTRKPPKGVHPDDPLFHSSSMTYVAHLFTTHHTGADPRYMPVLRTVHFPVQVSSSNNIPASSCSAPSPEPPSPGLQALRKCGKANTYKPSPHGSTPFSWRGRFGVPSSSSFSSRTLLLDPARFGILSHCPLYPFVSANFCVGSHSHGHQCTEAPHTVDAEDRKL
jgi:hypothetical protein